MFQVCNRNFFVNIIGYLSDLKVGEVCIFVYCMYILVFSLIDSRVMGKEFSGFLEQVRGYDYVLGGFWELSKDSVGIFFVLGQYVEDCQLLFSSRFGVDVIFMGGFYL